MTSTTKRKYILFFLEVIFILSVLMGGLITFRNRMNLPVYDSDEVSWIFTGYYFNLYWVHHNVFHPDWNDYEAFDQPPLAKYIIGGILYLKGYPIESLEPKRFLNRIPLVNPQQHFDQVTPQVPNPKVVMPLLRSVIFTFALSALLLLYLSARILYGFLPALISTALIAANPIFGTVSTRVLGDPILLFFFALFILFCALYSRTRRNIYIVFAFIASALAFSTKLNGILLLPTVILFFVTENRFSNWRRNLKVLMTGFLAFLLITLVINPVFLNSGMSAIWKMTEARLAAFTNYQETFKHAALLSISERFAVATQMIFFQNSLFYHFINVPVELIMFLIGTYYALLSRDPLLILTLLFLVIIPISILPFKLPRYCYWIFPFAYIIAGLSPSFIIETLKPLGRKWTHRQKKQ